MADASECGQGHNVEGAGVAAKEMARARDRGRARAKAREGQGG
jgi:hypothetical protein